MNRRGKISALLLFMAIAATVPLVSHFLQERDHRPPAELYSVVYRQLTAVRDDDFPSAYRHASSGIQQQFNVQQFAAMIRNDYGSIATAQRIEFGFMQRRGRKAVLQVFLIDREGQITPCVYNLIYEGAVWKIEGARIDERWPAGARLGGVQS